MIFRDEYGSPQLEEQWGNAIEVDIVLHASLLRFLRGYALRYGMRQHDEQEQMKSIGGGHKRASRARGPIMKDMGDLSSKTEVFAIDRPNHNAGFT